MSDQRPTRVKLDPDVSDEAPVSASLTAYDEEHLITYFRLLDAMADGADWREATRVVLHRDPDLEPDRAKRCWTSHVARAQWIAKTGWRDLLREDG